VAIVWARPTPPLKSHGSRGRGWCQRVTLEFPGIRHLSNLEPVVTFEGTADIQALGVGGALTGIQTIGVIGHSDHPPSGG
jgi:hypothetical protein